ncbi:MAG: RNase adapter protein RapZ [Actinomycetota bacterium]|nr:RNase adapter protein RapZ [Actinomycetota bacterium]
MTEEVSTTPGPHLPELVIITGMSGAGRSTTANVLEDLGWFVVDNLPPALLPTLAELGGRAQGNVPRIAAVVDVRSGSFFSDLTRAVDELTTNGNDPRVVFLEASDDSLVRRHEAVRRPHPLQGDGLLSEGISREREMLRDLRADADIVIDTSNLNVHELSAKVLQAFEESSRSGLHATIISFGYKYGLPVDADLVVDCRFLPNPHWVPDLRPLTGRDQAVTDYVLGQPGAGEFVEGCAQLLELVSEGYLREGKRFATVAVGCTGGKHRSVAITEELAGRLRGAGMDVAVVHRDLGRE